MTVFNALYNMHMYNNIFNCVNINVVQFIIYKCIVNRYILLDVFILDHDDRYRNIYFFFLNLLLPPNNNNNKKDNDNAGNSSGL